jgi:hypothetical protein
MALTQWGETYTPGMEGPALDIRRTDGDAPVRVVVECSAEHSTLSPRDVTARLGTGARPRS